MRTIRGFGFRLLLGLAVALAFAAASRAGEGGPPSLPKGVALAISIRSAPAFLDALDEFSVAIMRDTDKAVPPGLVKSLVQSQLPVPAALWDREPSLHLLLHQPLGSAAIFNHSLIVSGVGFDELKEALEQAGLKVDSKSAGTALIANRSGLPYMMKSAGEERVVMSPNPIMLKAASDALDAGWEPRPWGEGVLAVACDKPAALWGNALSAQALRAGVENLRKRVKLDLEAGGELPGGIDEGFFLAVLDGAEEYLPGLAAELAGIKGLILDVRMDGERVGAALGVFAAPETYASRVAASAAGRENLESPLFRNVGEGSVAAILSAPFQEALPGAGPATAEFFDRLGARLGLERDAVGIAKVADYFFRESGAIAVEERFDGGALSVAAWIGTSEPARMVDEYVDSFAAMNGVLGAALPEVETVYAVGGGTTPGGVAYRRVDTDPRFSRAMMQLGPYLFGQKPPPSDMSAMLVEQNILVASGDGQLVLAMGKTGEAGLDAAIGASGGAEKPMWENGAFREALADLRHRQTALMFIDYNQMLTELLGIAALGGTPGTFFSREAYAEAKPRLLQAKSMVGLSVGAADGRLVLDSVFPAETVNVIMRNIVVLREAANKTRPAGKPALPGGVR